MPLDLYLPPRPQYFNKFVIAACEHLGLDQYEAELIVTLRKNLDCEHHGLCWGDNELVEIEIATSSFGQSLSRKDKLLAVSHELIHARQYLSGQLSNHHDDGRHMMRWKNRIYAHRDPPDDAKHPWEVEAYREEETVYLACCNT